MVLPGATDEACMEAFVTASSALEELDVTDSAAEASASICSEPAEDGVSEAGALQGRSLLGDGSKEHEGLQGDSAPCAAHDA